MDRLGSVSLSWGLVPDLDFWVTGDGMRLPGTNETDSLSHA